MEPKELPESIAAKVEAWLSPNHSVLHFWNCHETYMVVALSRAELYCLRVFSVGDELQISQDNKTELDLR